MPRLAVTRYNNQTWAEYHRYTETHDIQGCCYNTPVPVQDRIPSGEWLYVLEMNNDMNLIMGIGLIRNRLIVKVKYHIFSEGNYNRYNYRSNYRLDRSEVEDTFLSKLEKLVFKHKTHMKRGHGIQCIGDTVYASHEYSKKDIELQLKQGFCTKYPTLFSKRPI